MRDVWASARWDKMASRWACPRARTSLSRERGQPAAPTRKRRTTSKTSIFVVQKTSSGTRWRFRSAAVRKIFFVVITVSVDGKEAWSVMSVDFEEALGRCDIRTNTVVPILCLRLGTPRRCCTSRILSCNRLVHALRHVSCATSLSLFVWIGLSTTEASCCNGGRDTFWNCLCVSLSLSPSQSSFLERNLSGQWLWLWSTVFFLFLKGAYSIALSRWRNEGRERERERDFFNFVKEWWWDCSPQRQAIGLASATSFSHSNAILVLNNLGVGS